MRNTIIDFERMEGAIGELAANYGKASPFPSIAIDDVLRIDPVEVASFPDLDWEHWNKLGDRYQHQKFSCNDLSVIPEPFAQIIHESASPRFLRILEAMTGIEKLIPDPYLAGGGLHLSGPGGTLAPHTDFHIYRALDIYRQINVIVYLNEGWEEGDGGSLTLYDGEQAVKAIVPAFGRMAVFTTNDKSVHGFPVPVADGKWRRSIALYYYTAVESEEFSGDETTYWRQHDKPTGVVTRVRFMLYRALLQLSRVISIVAHVTNPLQGMGLVKTALENKKRERKRRQL